MDRYEVIAILVLSLFLIPIGYLVFIFVVTPLRFHFQEKRHPAKTIDDPVFGSIEFRDGLWSSVPSPKIGHMVIVDAPATGPTQYQRDFYGRVRKELSTRQVECKTFIAQDASAPQNLSELSVYAVEIGTDSEIAEQRFVIELSDMQADEIHRIEFIHGKPEHYGIND